MQVSLYAPNGAYGCLTVYLFGYTFCAGFIPGMFGVDFTLRSGRMLFAIPRSAKL
jgi:hypothetical protein